MIPVLALMSVTWGLASASPGATYFVLSVATTGETVYSGKTRMEHTPPRPRRIALAVRLLRRVAQARGFLPVIGLVAAADYALWFLPSKTLVIIAAVAHPRHWWRISAWFTAGSVVGATAFAALVAYMGPPVLEWAFGDLSNSTAWQRAHALVLEWGAAALFVLAALPWPLRTIVAACAVLQLPLAVIAGSILVGRFMGFCVLTWLCGRAPNVLLRSPRLREAFAEATASDTMRPEAGT